MTMKLIREEIEKVEVLTEEKNGKKSLYIKGPFLQAEVVNRNGRMYQWVSWKERSRDMQKIM